MNESEQVALRVIDVLEELEIPYHVGGSFASSIHGIPRQTNDLDLVVELPRALVPLFVANLEKEFYLDAEAIQHAIQRHGHFFTRNSLPQRGLAPPQGGYRTG